ncbi:MAG: 2Fe-2S iron-sulfur cluster-binding protein, partial [Planctomycetota bacterium]
MHRIRFLPEDAEVTIEGGATLLDAARAANVYVGSVCGGKGVCGKCRVVVKEGKVEPRAEGKSSQFLTPEEVKKGYALACRVAPKTDLVVEVPPESRLGADKEAESRRYRDFTAGAGEPAAGELDPVVRKLALTIPEPTLDDATADRERVLDRVGKEFGGPVGMGLEVTREL